MKPAGKQNSILTFFLFLVSIALIVATSGFRIPVTLASASTVTYHTGQIPTPASNPVSISLDTPKGAPQAITWTELVSFLEKDHTNWNPYVPGKYTCLDFSRDLVANAAAQGIKAWIVAVDFKSGGPGHAFVAFETIDRGVIFVEPQADDTYPTVVVGKNLCDSWGVYQCMGTVSSIQYLQCDKAHFCSRYTP
jgi:hypothetical protein